MPKMSMNEVTTFRWSFLEDVTAFSKAGLDGIGIWRPKLTEFGEERAVELLQEHELPVSSLSWAGGFTGAYGYSFREAVDDAREAILLAAEIRAKSLVLISGGRNGHTVNHSRRLLREALAELGDFAAEHQVELALQPVHPLLGDDCSFLSSIDELLEVLVACDHAYVGMVFDAFHLGSEANAVDRIREMFPFVTTVKLSDGSRLPLTRTDQVMLGDGKIPLNRIVDTFEQYGYEGFYDVGICSQDLWRSDYNHMIGNCLDRFDRLFLDESVEHSPQATRSE